MYKVNFDNKDIELPNYSVAIAKKIDDLDKVEGDIDTKLEALYDFIQDTIGSEKTAEVLKSFSEADPNMINILFLSIVDAYNKPFTNYQLESGLDILDSPQIQKSLNTINAIVEANKAND